MRNQIAKKMDDKGFSLVELIIVIAIMAILVGVVGTQVVPYLEKSRRGRDFQVFSAWNTAGMSSYSMIADKVCPSDTYVIRITDDDVTCEDPGLEGADALVETFCDLSGLPASGSDLISSKMTSREGNEVKVVRIIIPATGASITTRIYTDDSASTESEGFDAIENR